MSSQLSYSDFEQCRPWMVNLAVKHGIDHDTAQDIAQEALIKIYTKGIRDGYESMSYKGRVNTAYVAALVRNASFDILKSKKAKQAPLSDLNALEDMNPHPDQENAPEEALCHLFAYLNRFEWFHYQVAVIHFIQRVPITDLSKQSGINKRTLYKSLSYVKTQIEQFKSQEAKGAQAHRYIQVEGEKSCNLESLPTVASTKSKTRHQNRIG